MEWFRLYHDLLNDPKVQKLPAPLFKFWINLLCLASANTERGVVPDVADIVFHLRISEKETRANLKVLTEKDFFDVDKESGIVSPHGWSKRQKESDDVAKRVALLRSKKGSETVTVTPDVTLQKRYHNPISTPDVTLPSHAREPEAEAEQKQIQRQSRAEQTREPKISNAQNVSAPLPPASAFLEQAPVSAPAPMPPEIEKPVGRVITVTITSAEWEDLLSSTPKEGGERWKRGEIWAGLEELSSRSKPPRDAAALLHSSVLPDIRSGKLVPQSAANSPPARAAPIEVDHERIARLDAEIARNEARRLNALAMIEAREKGEQCDATANR